MVLSPSWVSLVAASLVFVIGSASLTQKTRNDRRDAWWKRAQWAIDKALSDAPLTRLIGIQALGVLSDARGLHRDDLRIIGSSAVRGLDTDDATPDTEPWEE